MFPVSPFFSLASFRSLDPHPVFQPGLPYHIVQDAPSPIRSGPVREIIEETLAVTGHAVVTPSTSPFRLRQGYV